MRTRPQKAFFVSFNVPGKGWGSVVAVRRDGNLGHFIAQVVNTRAIGVTSVAARPETDDRRVERALVRHRADTGVHPYEKYTRAIGKNQKLLPFGRNDNIFIIVGIWGK